MNKNSGRGMFVLNAVISSAGVDSTASTALARKTRISDPYRVAWPLIKSGTYWRRTGSIEDFCGCLAREGGPKLTIAQIKKVTVDAWAGKQ